MTSPRRCWTRRDTGQFRPRKAKTMTTHRQCTLTSGTHKQVAWIEAKHARVGLNVKLKTDDSWWVVDEVYGELPSKVVQERGRDHAKHRESTDV